MVALLKTRVVRTPLAFRRSRGGGRRRTVRCTGRLGTSCAGGSRGRANGLIDEFQLAHLNHEVVLAYAKKTANPNHDGISLSRLVEQNFTDTPAIAFPNLTAVEIDPNLSKIGALESSSLTRGVFGVAGFSLGSDLSQW